LRGNLSTLSEIIWIRKGDPARVLVKKDKPSVHYFYWKRDLYRPEDYEPIMLISSSNQEIIVSRYHWIFTMVWNNVAKIKDKAVADFIAGIHTPIILCRKTNVLIVFDIKDFDLKSQLALDFILRILKRKYGRLKGVSEKEIKVYLDKITIVDRIEEKYRFEKEGKYIILVGVEQNKLNQVLNKVRQSLSSAGN
jgi:hypothetical protein